MKSNFFTSLPFATRVLVLLYALGFPLALLGARLQLFDLFSWMPLFPAAVWKGEVWRLVSYGFLGGGVVDWAVSLFWLLTLVAVVGRNWSGRGFWLFSLMAIIAGALPFVVVMRTAETGFTGNAALIFALLVAWDRIYRRERMVLLGFGEISVRQAVVLVAVIETLVVGLCCGWVVLLSMMCGGLAAWIYFTARTRSIMGASSRTVPSERIARLEL